jgi:hypothetical protein
MEDNMFDLENIRTKTDNERPKRDLIVEAADVSISPISGKLVIPQGDFELTEWATTQLCGKLKIPIYYYKSCPNDVKAVNANCWLPKHKRPFMFRINNSDICRAVLSTRYNSINNADLVDVTTSVVNGTGKEINVTNYWVEDKGFDIRAVFPTANEIYWGFHLTNSEVGYRRLGINTVLYNKNNNSSLIRPIDIDSIFSHKHMGEITIDKVGGSLAHTLEVITAKGDELIDQFTRTKDIILTEDEAKSIATGVRNKLKKTEKFVNDVLDRFNIQGSKSLFHLINAITTYAEDLPIEQRLDLELEAGRLIDMY